MSRSYADNSHLTTESVMKLPITVSLYRFSGDVMVRSGGNRFIAWIHSAELDRLFPGRALLAKPYDSVERAFQDLERYIYTLVSKGYITPDECSDWLSASAVCEMEECSPNSAK